MPLTTAAVAVTMRLWPMSPPNSNTVLWKALRQAGGEGEGRLSTFPCVRVYIEIGTGFREGDGVGYPPTLFRDGRS